MTPSRTKSATAPPRNAVSIIGCTRYAWRPGSVGALWQRLGAVLGESENALMEAAQGRAMADADDGRPPGQRAQHAVERRLAILVERRRRLVEEDRGGFGEQHPRESEPFLLAARQALRPIVDFVEIGREMAESDLVEHLEQPLPLDAGAI